MSEEYEETRNMSMRELTRMVCRHDKDMYRGNGKPGITTRLATLEDYMDRTDGDLYDKESGLVPKLTEFFAVLGEREKQSSRKMALYMAFIAFIAIAVPISWDLMKHAFGWMR